MKDTSSNLVVVLTALTALCAGLPGPVSSQHLAPKGVLVIHGGAGSITADRMPEDRRQAYEEKLKEALTAGYGVLEEGGSSLDAVVATVTVMEDSPLFNAARGAVLTSAGLVELDASIMDGASRKAGAVASVKRASSPIRLARAVMEQSDYVLLVGDGADTFAREVGLKMVPNEHFRTNQRMEQYERYRERQSGDTGAGTAAPLSETSPYGTVGAVALDRGGNLAAATSTGGTSYKKWSRVGDSAIIGGGTYADNETCAVSATGTGEYFIRGVLAFRISALMNYAGLSLQEAAASVIHGTLTSMGGDGGVIGLDRDGNVTMTFNTAGMFRGYADDEGNLHVAMFAD